MLKRPISTHNHHFSAKKLAYITKKAYLCIKTFLAKNYKNGL